MRQTVDRAADIGDRAADTSGDDAVGTSRGQMRERRKLRRLVQVDHSQPRIDRRHLLDEAHPERLHPDQHAVGLQSMDGFDQQRVLVRFAQRALDLTQRPVGIRARAGLDRLGGLIGKRRKRRLDTCQPRVKIGVADR